MRRLGWLCVVILLPAVGTGCPQANPAFNDCESPELCPDADSGDSMVTNGDGDGDGDNQTAPDPTGDPSMIPACPETVDAVIPLAQDTFLDRSNTDLQECLVEWDYNTGQPGKIVANSCGDLDFGGIPMHWACGGQGPCNSTWLGQFAVEDWAAQALVVKDAYITARVKSGGAGAGGNITSINVLMYELNVETISFGECDGWMAGEGHGILPEDCVTTGLFSAHPSTWADGNSTGLELGEVISADTVPLALEYAYHDLTLPIATQIAERWLTGEHEGVLLTANALEPTHFNMLAQGSESPPQLVVKLCAGP